MCQSITGDKGLALLQSLHPYIHRVRSISDVPELVALIPRARSESLMAPPRVNQYSRDTPARLAKR